MAEQAHQTGTEAPGGQHGAFPPFNSQTFPSQFVWLVISFVLLYALMAKWALPQVARVVEGRQKGIADDLAEADKLKRQSEEAVAAYEKALADARANAQAIANETRDKQAAAAEATRKRLEDELNRKLADSLDVGATPTFIIGDQVVEGAVPIEQMKELIAKARKS